MIQADNACLFSVSILIHLWDIAMQLQALEFTTVPITINYANNSHNIV